MGQAKRRRDAGERPSSDVKISRRKRQAGFLFAHVNRIEEQGEDGIIRAVNVFCPIDEAGHPMIEETPDGPRMVLIRSIAQPVRRAVIATPGRVTVAR